MAEVLRFCPQCARPLTSRTIDGVERRCCPDDDCAWVFWGNPVPVVAALVECPGGILLARNAAWAPGQFGLITGFLEADEAPEAAVAREVGEELGLRVERSEWIGNYAFSRQNQVILAYHVIASGELRLNDEIAEVRVIAPKRLRAWELGTGLAVRDWLARRQAYSGASSPM